MKRRFVIYFHYDPQGLIDTACRLAVSALQRHCEKLWLVTNGKLTPAARIWTVQSGAALLERENIGFDVGAYREALYAIGREALAGYDELILMNYTLAGPVVPLDGMFEAMDARPELDFWGLTRHYAMQSRRFGGMVPEHLQSHFLALRPSLFLSDSFWDYWQTIRLPQSYEQSVILHEIRFTAYFSEKGFRWDSYVNTEAWEPVFVNPLMACPRELLTECGCPFFKRRTFFTDYTDELRRTDGNAARLLYDYVKEHTDYPIDFLMSSLLRTQPLSTLAQNMHWHYVLPREIGTTADLQAQGLRVVQVAPLKTGDAATDYYMLQANREAEQQLASITVLFAEQPLLGMAAPALPARTAAVASAQQSWKNEYRILRKNLPELPIEETIPPPAPCTGWAVVRLAAYPDGIPENGWLLPLMAQKNGFYSAVFEQASAMAARTEMLMVSTAQSQNATAVAKQLARLAKHKLRGGHSH